MRVYNQIAVSFEGEHNILGILRGEFVRVRTKSRFMWYWGPIFLN